MYCSIIGCTLKMVKIMLVLLLLHHRLVMYRMPNFRDPWMRMHMRISVHEDPRKRMHMRISKDGDPRMRMQMRISVQEDPRMRMRMRIFGILISTTSY